MFSILSIHDGPANPDQLTTTGPFTKATQGYQDSSAAKRALVAVLEDPGSIPNTHNYPKLQSQGIQCPLLASITQGIKWYTQAGKNQFTQNKIIKKKKKKNSPQVPISSGL